VPPPTYAELDMAVVDSPSFTDLIGPDLFKTEPIFRRVSKDSHFPVLLIFYRQSERFACFDMFLEGDIIPLVPSFYIKEEGVHRIKFPFPLCSHHSSPDEALQFFLRF